MSGPVLVVGITGRSGSGKSGLAAYYAARGYPVADGDAISREVTVPGSECLAALAAEFGADILDETGALRRRLLAERAFASPEKNKRLVDITHPYILRRFLAMVEEAARAGHRLFFVDGAMIVGGIFEPYCDRLIVVTAAQRLAVSRIVLRDNISKTAAVKRLEAQPPEELLADKADYLVPNNGTLAQLHEAGGDILEELERLACEADYL